MSMPIGTGAPPPPPANSSRGTTALILGIVGIVCCGLAAPVAWYMGNQELQAIRSGMAPASGEGSAKAGMVLGIIGTVFLALGIVWVFVGGGMAFLSAMSQHH